MSLDNGSTGVHSGFENYFYGYVCDYFSDYVYDDFGD